MIWPCRIVFGPLEAWLDQQQDVLPSAAEFHPFLQLMCLLDQQQDARHQANDQLGCSHFVPLEQIVRCRQKLCSPRIPLALTLQFSLQFVQLLQRLKRREVIQIQLL